MPNTKEETKASASRFELWADRLNRMSRPRRILLCLAITLELVILASIVIDRTLLDRVYEGSVGSVVPAWVAVILGFLFYGIGWWAVVGFDWDPEKPWRAGKAAVSYVAVGGAALILMVMLILSGLALGYIL